MKYFSVVTASSVVDGKGVEELTPEKARFCLEGAYKKEFVDELFENNVGFRLKTPYRVIWTQTEDGMVPIAGFYGTVG